MTIRRNFSLVTVSGNNEQSAASQVTATASGNSREFGEFASFQRGIVFLDVSAVSGTTPNLVVALQHQDPASLKWQNTSAVFPAQTAVTPGTPLAPLTLELYAIMYRLSWTITGTTPSFTFSCNIIVNCEEAIT